MTTSPYDTYTSPLATRNASPEMLRLWSARHKFNTWRKIWLAVAEAQHELGIGSGGGAGASPGGSDGVGVPGLAPGPLVSREQVEELRSVVNRPGGITDEEMRAAERYERELRHDVMAHVHALGDSCPKAKGIVHLGMTSQDVVCNADLMIIAESNRVVDAKVRRLVLALGDCALAYKSMPTLGFTHYQPAQPQTVGRRVAGWASELLIVEQHHRMSRIHSGMIKGLRGATGTQASYLALCGDDPQRVDVLEEEFFKSLMMPNRGQCSMPAPEQRAGIEAFEQAQGKSREVYKRAMETPGLDPKMIGAFKKMAEKPDLSKFRLSSQFTFAMTGQTYPRVVDCLILSDLAATAAVMHKIASDIRLLCNRKEIDEPFEEKQIGSSAMPYKRNPMRCERVCGLARFVMNLVGNAYDTAATQWLERTLDDSSNRRLSLPEAFLALDGALDLMHNVASGLIVHEATVRKNLMAELPFMATENLLMACVKLGGDRQHYHEVIRVHAQAAGMRVKQEGLENDLLERLKNDPAFHPPALRGELDGEGLMDPMKYVGRSVEQTERFVAEVVGPLRERYGEEIEGMGGSGPRV
jgi:adenylosuccinate lyase